MTRQLPNQNTGYFTCYRGSFTGPVFLAFLDRLVRHLDRKIHLVVDGHPVHRRIMVRDWLAERVENIEMHFLPGYAPELDPVELLNGDIKRHVYGSRHWRCDLVGRGSGWCNVDAAAC